ncbi:GTP-binding protein [Apostasia shenzhenica]|uniref:GTP-binding protein n=1 Tax=Apostasia shenzhenica TaxID=1088818 RepID=A0A2I0B2V4_9ASPA|nr:GTP-binding protein [Apostasia shenzhenica]
MTSAISPSASLLRWYSAKSSTAMISAFPFPSISSATAALANRSTNSSSFQSFSGLKLSPLNLWRTGIFRTPGTLEEAMAVEISNDASSTAVDVASNGLPAVKSKPEEEETEIFDSHADVSGRKKKKVDDPDVNSYDRFKLNNGREVFEEKAYLVGVECKGGEVDKFGIEESLSELSQLADTAGLLVVGSTCQRLATPNPKTYIGSGKAAEIKSAVHALDVETVIFDDELSAGQLRNLEKTFGGDVRVCDRTALILDIFDQRAATHEASLQVSLAQMEYQLPRLTKMWTHLERQAGGKVKGMGEKQIEVDKRILRTRIGNLKKELESVRKHRKLYRNRRSSVPIPVVSLVGYTNAGKSTLLNRLTGADVLAEDRLFATLDPTTRKVQMSSGNEFLLTDTVGFIQKLPTMLVAAFRATLEEISESSLLVHVVDISHPLAHQQTDAVNKVLQELDVEFIPKLVVWNKVDKADDPHKVKYEAEKKGILCISAITGDGLDRFCDAVQAKLRDSMVKVEAFVPYGQGDLLSTIHQVGIVEETEYMEQGTIVRAYVPLSLARSLTPVRQKRSFIVEAGRNGIQTVVVLKYYCSSMNSFPLKGSQVIKGFVKRAFLCRNCSAFT